MALFLLCPNLGWIQGQFNFTELSLRYRDLSSIPSYNGYIVLPYNEFMRRGLTLGVGNEFVPLHVQACYPTEENMVSIMVGLETRDKLYSNQAVMICL